MAERVLTIAQLNAYVEGTLKHDPILRAVSLRGEVSNFGRNASFFSLKDEFASIRCALFGSVSGVEALRDGASVVVRGYVSLYARTGQYQFYVQEVRPDGVGELYARFEAYKAELGKLGYFDEARKRPLPFLPRRIGIVTSPTGAVIHDIERIAHRRLPSARLLLCPAKVQGEGAAGEIARAIGSLNEIEDVDVIIVGRGGGSMEDLWAFNERVVADAIYHSAAPVISAVGHETDFTIADFVADLRAPTPSAAAELAVPRQSDLADAVTVLSARLRRAAQQLVRLESARLERLKMAHAYQQPGRRIEHDRALVAHLFARLTASAKGDLLLRRAALRSAMEKLDGLSPLSSLRRGYSLVLLAGRPVASVSQLQSGDAVELVLGEGKASARIETLCAETT